MTSLPTTVIWAIGGVDCLGVAGILADSRAAQATGVHCATIVSCVTAQNSAHFLQLNPTDVELLNAQWQALSEQTRPNVIKIGLIANAQQARWLGDKLAAYRESQSEHQNQLRVIYDPVLASSNDNDLVCEQTLSAIKEFLLPQVDLLTPNLNEAQALSGLTLNNASDLVALARTLSREFELSVLLKGGHLAASEIAYDCYIAKLAAIAPREPVTSFVMASPFIDNDNIRGTGCNLASLIASHLANDLTLCDALVLAKATINQAIMAAKPLGNHCGGLSELTAPADFDYLPQILTINQFLERSDSAGNALSPAVTGPPFAQCEANLGLYPVVDSYEWLERLLRLGVKTIQLRAKDFCDQDLEPQVIKAIALGQQYQARIFINDHWQLAIKHRAYGVHLGQEDLQLADLDQIRQAGLRLGLSTHGIYEAIVAEQLQPSYIALGHIFATRTKEMPSTPQGINNLRLQVALFKSQRALVAIGGISTERVNSIVNTGIGSVAVVTAITEADDVSATTKSLLAQIGGGDQLAQAIVNNREVADG